MSRTTLNLSGKRGKILTFAIREGYYFFSVSGLCFVLGGERRVEKGERRKEKGEWRERSENNGAKIDTAALAARRLTEKGLGPGQPVPPGTPGSPGPWNPDPGGNVEQALTQRGGTRGAWRSTVGARRVENPISTRTRTRTQTNSKNRRGAKLRKMRTQRRAHTNEIHYQAHTTTHSTTPKKHSNTLVEKDPYLLVHREKKQIFSVY